MAMVDEVQKTQVVLHHLTSCARQTQAGRQWSALKYVNVDSACGGDAAGGRNSRSPELGHKVDSLALPLFTLNRPWVATFGTTRAANSGTALRPGLRSTMSCDVLRSYSVSVN